MSVNKKSFTKWAFIIFPIVVVIIIALFNWNSVKDIGKAFGSLNLFWVTMGLLAMICFWLLDGYILHYITASMYPKKKYLLSLRTAIIGQYYCAITPFASGGQPMQVVYMKKDGMPVGISTSVVTVKFITFQAGVCLFYLISMATRFNYFYTNYNDVFWLSLVGFLINIAVIFFLILGMFKENFVRNAAKKIINFLHKIHLVKNTEKWQQSTAKTLDDFQKSIVFLKSHPWKIAYILLINLIHLVFMFSVGFFVCRAFGVYTNSIADMVMLQGFLYITVSYFPIPGGSGANEAGFYLFFQKFFVEGQNILLGMILWRLITYYFTLLAGILTVLLDGIFSPKEKKEQKA